MENNQGFAMGRGGYALAVLSRRCRGHVVPVDLLRVVASVANRAGVRRRVSAAFAGYLVTDAGPGVVPMFSARRAAHEYGILSECVTGAGGVGFFYGGLGEGGGPIDAPILLPSGAMRSADFGKYSGVVHRWSELLRVVDWPVMGEEVPIWRDRAGRVVVLGRAVTGMAMAGDDDLLREDFAGALAGAAIDAPDYLLSGSVQEWQASDRCVTVGRFWRDGAFS